MRHIIGTVVQENRSPTGQRLPNTYYGVASHEEAAGIEAVKVWTWEELEEAGPSWEPPAYRCGGVTAKGTRCERVIFGEKFCHWHRGRSEFAEVGR